jgi:hypothetical protein
MSGTALMAFDDLDVEALAVIANESAEQVESSARKTVEHAERCGRALLAAKEKLPHGKFTAWLGSNFDYSERHAQRYMHIALNTTRVADLKDATSLREALRMIAEDPETPKRERKPSVEVVEPIEVTVKEPAPEKTAGETATNAVSREETRKAPAHRPPEKFTPVTPSYADEEPEAVPMRLESGFDEVEATERIRSLIHKEMARWPADRHAEAIQVFQLYLGSFDNE